MSFWSSLFGGSSPQLTSALNNTGQLAGFTQGQGQANTTAGSNFFSSVLSGDQSKIAKALAPEISTSQQQAQQAKKSSAEFGTRSGGTAASNANIDTAARGNIINLVGGLQSGSAGSLLSSGSSLLGTALSGYGQQAQIAQQQQEDWANSLFGKGITSGLASGESAGLGFLGI